MWARVFQKGQKAVALSTAFVLFLSSPGSCAYGVPAPPQAPGANQKSNEQTAASYRKAAETGDTRAMYELGLMYQSGKGVPQSYEDASKWYAEAAEKDYDPAKIGLGILYQNGWGVDVDVKKAGALYASAKNSKDSEIARAAKKLGLLAQEVAEGRSPESEDRISPCGKLATVSVSAVSKQTNSGPAFTSQDGFVFGTADNRDQRRFTATVEEFARALPGIIQCSASAKGLPARDYSKESDYIISRVRACSGLAPLDADNCPQAPGFGIQPVSDRVRTYDHDKERGLAMQILPAEQWGDGKGLLISLMFTQLPSD